jgi:hypothetical protein
LEIKGEETMTSSLKTPPWDHPRSLLPVPRRSRNDDQEVVIEQVVEKASASIVYPVLTRMNYSEWSLVKR